MSQVMSLLFKMTSNWINFTRNAYEKIIFCYEINQNKSNIKVNENHLKIKEHKYSILVCEIQVC